MSVGISGLGFALTQSIAASLCRVESGIDAPDRGQAPSVGIGSVVNASIHVGSHCGVLKDRKILTRSIILP